jgi:hypothetical protein
VPPVATISPPVVFPPGTLVWVTPPTTPTLAVTEAASPPTALEITEEEEEVPAFVAPQRVPKIFRN